MDDTERVGRDLINAHVRQVQYRLSKMIQNLMSRMIGHDASKLSMEEHPLVLGKAHLNSLDYDSAEYHAALAGVSSAIQHHYAENRHHPEHYPNGVKDMTLLDLLEMICDWNVAAIDNGTEVDESLEKSIVRFNVSPEIADILRNTYKEMKWL